MSVPDGLEVFGSIPMRDAFAWENYITAVDGVVAQTEAVGGRGILIYTDNTSWIRGSCRNMCWLTPGP